MAISESCKFELKSHVDRLVREKEISRLQAIQILANESDQPVETLRKQDFRARSELGQSVPKYEQKQKCKKCGRRFALKDPEVNFIGLCRWCRDNEVRKERVLKIIEERKKTPIDQISEKFWLQFIDMVNGAFNGNVPTGKVSEDVLDKVGSAQNKINRNYNDLFKSSEPKYIS